MGRNNNFDFLRQFAAFLVIVGHSQVLLGGTAAEFWGVSVSTFGLHIFFSLSGYLVTESWLRDPSIGPFLKKRSRRIFPGLTVCVLLTILVLGPMLTSLPVTDYLQRSKTLHYAKNILMEPIYFLPGLFEANIYKNAVNGSLWSLPVEFACYIGVLAAGLLIRRPLAWLAFGLGLGMAVVGNWVLQDHAPIVIYGSPVKESLAVMCYFAAGAGYRMLRDRLAFRADFVVVAVALMLATGIVAPGQGWLVAWVAVPYLVLAFGLGDLPVIRRFGRFGDPSFGMYLYAFPIQQTIIYLSGNQASVAFVITLTTLLSVACGFASWHLVERRALHRANPPVLKAATP